MWGTPPDVQPTSARRVPSASAPASARRSVYNAPREVLRCNSMIFKQKRQRATGGRRSAGRRRCRRASRALVRESWWLLVVAAFVYLALILATYTRTDPGWSFSGTGAPIANKGGVVGAWLSDLLLYLFGLSAWWWVVAGVVLVVAGYRRIVRSRARDAIIRLRSASLGFALVLLSSAALEALRLYRLPATLPHRARRRARRRDRAGARARLGFNGATLLLLALFAIGWSLFFGMSWLRLMERIGAGIETLDRVGARAARGAPRSPDRRRGARPSASRSSSSCARSDEEREPIVVVPPAVDVPKSERVVKEKQRPLFHDMPDSPLPPLALLEDAPSAQEAVSAETLEFTSRLIERKLADFGVAVKVLAAYPGPVITRFEIEPAVGVKGAQIVNLMKDLARALSVVSIRVVETIPGKSCMGLELPNPQAADRAAGRDPVVDDLQRHARAR